MKDFTISSPSEKDSVNLALDTLKIGKQAIVFANTKDSAEKTAEDIAKLVKEDSSDLDAIALDVLEALQRPTKQCQRLAFCVKKGIAFHHAGLAHSQRQLIEKGFRERKIKVICSTPTLAAGVDLPAFRTIIKDLKRFSGRGLQYIPVLDYMQMAGRAGRPKYDTEGQAIAIATSKKDALFIYQKYIQGYPEEIYSKLGVEPVFRTYLLSLIASGYVTSHEDVSSFFKESFYAFQFRDMQVLDRLSRNILRLLKDWKFIVYPEDDFISADEIGLGKIKATLLGQRVSQLYLDPLTANNFVKGIEKSVKNNYSQFSIIQLICSALEMEPLLKVKISEYDDVSSVLVEHQLSLLVQEPAMYDEDYDIFLSSIKTTSFFMDWIDEKDEEFLLQKYSVRPGELRVKLDSADWLLYALEELARIGKQMGLIKEISKLRLRLNYGAKEELLPLLKLKGIGRVRARKLFDNGITDIGSVKNIELRVLSNLIGDSIAKEIKKQVGEKLPEELSVKENKRKGQINLDDFGSI